MAGLADLLRKVVIRLLLEDRSREDLSASVVEHDLYKRMHDS